MNLYSQDDERAIREQRMVQDWTASGLLIPEQRARMAPELTVDLRRTNRFLRITLFVFGYMIVNSLTGLFVVTSSALVYNSERHSNDHRPRPRRPSVAGRHHRCRSGAR